MIRSIRWPGPVLSQRQRDALIGGAVMFLAGALAAGSVIVALAIVAAGARDIIAWAWGS
jgi:hypothetical protein